MRTVWVDQGEASCPAAKPVRPSAVPWSHITVLGMPISVTLGSKGKAVPSRRISASKTPSTRLLEFRPSDESSMALDQTPSTGLFESQYRSTMRIPTANPQMTTYKNRSHRGLQNDPYVGMSEVVRAQGPGATQGSCTKMGRHPSMTAYDPVVGIISGHKNSAAAPTSIVSMRVVTSRCVYMSGT